MSHIRSALFVQHPRDWVGSTVEIFPDGMFCLDSGLFSKERKDAGSEPIATMRITETTTAGDIEAFAAPYAHVIEGRLTFGKP